MIRFMTWLFGSRALVNAWPKPSDVPAVPPIVVDVGIITEHYDPAFDTAGMPQCLNLLSDAIATHRYRLAEVYAEELRKRLDRVSASLKHKVGRDG